MPVSFILGMRRHSHPDATVVDECQSDFLLHLLLWTYAAQHNVFPAGSMILERQSPALCIRYLKKAYSTSCNLLLQSSLSLHASLSFSVTDPSLFEAPAPLHDSL